MNAAEAAALRRAAHRNHAARFRAEAEALSVPGLRAAVVEMNAWGSPARGSAKQEAFRQVLAERAERTRGGRAARSAIAGEQIPG